MSMIQAWSREGTPTLLTMSGSAAANPVRSTWNRKPLTLAATSATHANREEGFLSVSVELSASVMSGFSAMATGWPKSGLDANEAFSKPHETVSCWSR